MTSLLALRIYGLTLEELEEMEARCHRLLRSATPAKSFLGPRAAIIVNGSEGITYFLRESTSDKWTQVLVTPLGQQTARISSLAPHALRWLRSYMALDDLARI